MWLPHTLEWSKETKKNYYWTVIWTTILESRFREKNICMWSCGFFAQFFITYSRSGHFSACVQKLCILVLGFIVLPFAFSTYFCDWKWTKFCWWPIILPFHFVTCNLNTAYSIQHPYLFTTHSVSRTYLISLSLSLFASQKCVLPSN